MSALRGTSYDAAFNIKNVRELLLHVQHDEKEGGFLTLAVGTVALSVVNWFGKLYCADTLWLLETVE